MGTYSKLLETYREYLNKDEVINTEETISAYTLWKTISDEMTKYRYLTDDNHGLIEHINNVYKNVYKSTFLSGVDFYDESIERFNIKKPIFGPIKFLSIESCHSFDGKAAVFKFTLNTKIKHKHGPKENKTLVVFRDFNGDDYYGEVNRFLVYHCKEQLDEMFNNIKFFTPLLKEVKKEQNIDNGTLHISIDHLLCRKPTLNVRLSDKIDPDGDQFKQYSNEYCSIEDLMAGKEEELLKRTSVNISELSDFCQAIIKKNIEEGKIIIPKEREYIKVKK